MPDASIMTLQEIAELPRISERSVYRLAKDGQWPGFKPGEGAWRLRSSDVEARVHAQSAAGRERGGVVGEGDRPLPGEGDGGEDRGEA